nr:acetyl-CoA carboxylase biotin carboxyl carrier protein [uncultured Ruminococcus sp.]
MEVFKLKKYDLDDVKRLIELANKNDLSVLEIETKKGRRIRIEKNKPVAPAVAFNATAPTPTVAPAPVQAPVVETAPVQQSAPTQVSASKPSGKTIKAPMVGVFYKAASPEAEPYVTVGKTVKKGDTVCIIEAMKLMNEIQAEEDGTIKEILVKDGDIIEYGQPLFVIE